LATAGAKVRVGTEANGQAGWFERLPGELNFELWIGDATKIRAKRVHKQKTDRQDAQHILRLLKADFPRIWVPGWENRDPRQLLWHRHRVVLDVAPRMELRATGKLRFTRGTAWKSPWCELNHRRTDCASREQRPNLTQVELARQKQALVTRYLYERSRHIVTGRKARHPSIMRRSSAPLRLSTKIKGDFSGML
jgi:hypothetical protein